MRENLDIIIKLRRDYQRNFARAMSDFFVCVNENNLPFKILGKKINLGAEGLFGMLSALIYIYGMATANAKFKSK